jgi:hypothetical protein
MNCKVQYCRFPNTHVTKGHQCGICSLFGHGQVECTSPILCMNLATYRADIISLLEQCKMPNCKYKTLHKTEGHKCKKCANFGTNCTCKKDEIKIKCPICRTVSSVQNIDDIKILGLSEKCKVCMDKEICIRLPCKHTCICETCFNTIAEVKYNEPQPPPHELKLAQDRLSNGTYTTIPAGQGCLFYVKMINNSYETFFIHGDEWGQYGVDRSPQLYTFLSGCRNILIQ